MHEQAFDERRVNECEALVFDDIKKEPDKTYLLVAHNGISRIIESYFRDMTNEEFAAFGIKNAEVREYDF